MAYSNTNEHILDELHWLKYLIAAQVYRFRNLNFYEEMKNFREFFISDKEIDALLSTDSNGSEQIDDEQREKITNLLKQATKVQEKIKENVEESIAKDICVPVERIATCFKLSDFEVMVLIICLAPQVDPHYEKLYAYLNNDSMKRHPTIDLIFNLLNLSFDERISARDYFASQAPLFKFAILEFFENEYEKNIHLLSKQVKVNERIAGYLLGSDFIDNKLNLIAEFYYPNQKLLKMISPELVKKHLIKFITEFKNETNGNRQNFVFLFYGPGGTNKLETAGTMCEELGLPLLTIDMEAIKNLDLPLKQILELAYRESLLIPAALYLKNTEAILDEQPCFNKEIFLKIVNDNSWLSFISSTQLIDIQDQLVDQRYIQIEFTIPDYKHRQKLWQFYLNDQPLDPNGVDLDGLASKFLLTNDQVRNAVAMASNRALYKINENGFISTSELFECCRAQSNQKLKELSQKIKPQYAWKDIILPQNQMSQLREIINYVQYKHVVYGNWGFNSKFSQGKGLNILFSGSSGTGKTMAAEIMANELKLDLYKIDLSTVVSKYIGETEKNLSKIFNEAETSNAILFFDEADTLFGKRSEVKDAHDRYANIEIGYLLQKMDDYTGIVILATNLQKNIDEAFGRRMHFMLEFPFPEELDRLRIWQNIFPKETPLKENIDFNFLSKRFKLTGGNIKNVALAAAFFAANDGKIVTMEHLIKGIKCEYKKIGKLCVKADFGNYFNIVQKQL